MNVDVEILKEDFLNALINIEKEIVSKVNDDTCSWQEAIHLAIFSTLVEIEGEGETCGAQLIIRDPNCEAMEDIAGNLHHMLVKIRKERK